MLNTDLGILRALHYGMNAYTLDLPTSSGKYGANRLGLGTIRGKRPAVSVAASKRAAAKRRNMRARSPK